MRNEDRKPLTDRFVQAQEDLTAATEELALPVRPLPRRANRGPPPRRRLKRYKNRKAVRLLDKLGR
ncbi:hypothetical protein [Demequina litorisediminis]|uniref:hypothetical protein n=1 Tax=Demequina litorisediminis TaxID=1849022 RepID=UPI0024E0993C|nr:hypothetical protein [Demequina litorisediminis]